MSCTFKGEGKKLLFQPIACWAPWLKGIERSLLGTGSGVLGFISSLPFFSIDPVPDYLSPAQMSGLHRGRSTCQTWGLLRPDLTSTPQQSAPGSQDGPHSPGSLALGPAAGAGAGEAASWPAGERARGQCSPLLWGATGVLQRDWGDFVGHS